GHLLDSGIINRALDLVTDNGGSFQVLEFNLGEQRQSTSLARIRISAPSHDLMETIMGELIEIGAVLQDRDTSNANLEPVLQDGVAPDDFYVTTIYPTDACVEGEWIRCTNQRMDAAIAISPDGKTATCKLLRDLVVGDRVVVGYDGVRTVRKPEARDNAKKEEFSFMGAGVSSERRVELVVEQI
ncbi:MAG: fused N-dimethylarginine dimethylaminohydrolase/saccharopine dehydrogenase domain-containing protein, partial [Pseudanabaena sp.]